MHTDFSQRHRPRPRKTKLTTPANAIGSRQQMISLASSTMLEKIAFLLLGGLFGAIIGNWLALGRDRRKEFNAAAETIYLALEKEKYGCNGTPSHTIEGPSKDDLLRFKRHVSWLRQRGFQKALAQYNRAKFDALEPNKIVYTSSDVFYHKPELVIVAIDRLLRYTKRK